MKFYKTLQLAVIAIISLNSLKSLADLPEFKTADVQFWGDLFLSKRVLKKTGTTISEPNVFQNIEPLLKTAHVNIVNFEGVVSNSFVPFEMKSFLLNMPSDIPNILAASNIKYATLANNHSLDFGEQGLWGTMAALEEVGIEYAGAGANLRESLIPLIIPIRTKTLCVMPFSRTLPASFWAKKNKAGTAYLDFEKTTLELKKCIDAGFFTVAVFHWGAELMPKPKEYQQKLARLVIDAGVDVVIGHHPHILQTVEIYKNKLIAYSIGNFAFGSLTKNRIQEGMAVRINLPTKALSKTRIELVPINVDNNEVAFYPTLFASEELEALSKQMPKDKRCSFQKEKISWVCIL